MRRDGKERNYLMVAGLVFLPSFVFQPSLIVRSVQVSVVLFLYSLSGKRFKIIPPVILFISITAVNIIRPAGEVLFEIYGFPVTKDALLSGISRSLLLMGLVYTSRLCVSSSPDLPGRAGKMLGMVFYFFNRITSEELRLRPVRNRKLNLLRYFVEYFDKLLFLSDSISADYGISSADDVYDGSFRLRIFLLVFIGGSYTLLILNFLKYL